MRTSDGPKTHVGQRVVVVGAGVIGVCTAYYLAGAGWQVTVLEQGKVCAGCSHGNGGAIVPSHSVPLAAPGVWQQALRWLFSSQSPFRITPRFDPSLLAWLWRFRQACTEQHASSALPVLRDLSYGSRALFHELIGSEELDCRYQETGAMMVYRTPKGLAAGLDEAARLHAAGIPSQRLDLSEARGLAPALRPGVMGAIFFPDDAHLVPDAFVRQLARRAEDRGVAIRTETEVLGFRTSGRRILGIETTRGDLQADEVVLATGAWSPRLARTLGLRLPVQPAKGYSLTYDRGSGGPRVPVILAEAKAGITPMGDWLRFAGTLELSGFDLSINRRRVDAIVRAAAQYVDGLDSLPLREIWRGLRPCTPDGLPIIGRPSSLDNLILATGHAMLGVTLGPITGLLVSQLASRDQPKINLHALRPQRFE